MRLLAGAGLNPVKARSNFASSRLNLDPAKSIPEPAEFVPKAATLNVAGFRMNLAAPTFRATMSQFTPALAGLESAMMSHLFVLV